MGEAKPPGRLVLAAMAALSGGLLVLELTLTRIFSVTMWYHFAFMAISIAMLGLSAGAIFVHRFGRKRTDEELFNMLPILCAAFGVMAIASMAVVLRLRFDNTFGAQGMAQLLLIYALTTAPFMVGGGAIAIAVRKYGSSMSSIYSADLLGAGLACILVIPLLRMFGGPATVYVAALLAIGAGLLFSRGPGRRVTLASLILVLILFGTNTGTGLLRVVWAKEKHEEGLLYEAWNSFSRITVFPTEEGWNTQFFGWGMSPVYDGPLPRQLGMHIDSYAGTPISEYSGSARELVHLRYDVTALAYHLRPSGTHLVIGPGGGRDILASLAMGADSVVAVELNPEVVKAVNVVFGDFSGSPYSLPGVEGVVDEARSFLRRDQRAYDVIQASLVDTWAATAAGAFTLSENTLYTVEAMNDYLQRLSDHGLVSISRFLFEPPRETLRLFAVALTALDARGSEDPADHLAILSCKGVATLLVGKRPISPVDLDALKAVADSLQFSVVHLPGHWTHPVFLEMARRYDDPRFYDHYQFDVSPTTDDRPFFFNMVRPKDFLRVFQLNDLQGQTHSYDAVFILMSVVGIAFLMTVMLIVLPARTLIRGAGRTGLLFALYFVAIGLGFMLAEVTLLQKLVLFLGHPVYALSVVLLGLLSFGGLGSFWTRKVRPGRERMVVTVAGLCLVVLFIIAREYIDFPLMLFLGYSKTVRVVLALALLLPAGLAMGMLLPLGIRAVASWQKNATPWLWGVNGAASVLGSVLAFALAMNLGFKMTFLLAAVCYGIAVGVFLLLGIGGRKRRA